MNEVYGVLALIALSFGFFFSLKDKYRKATISIVLFIVLIVLAVSK